MVAKKINRYEMNKSVHNIEYYPTECLGGEAESFAQITMIIEHDLLYGFMSVAVA